MKTLLIGFGLLTLSFANVSCTTTGKTKACCSKDGGACCKPAAGAACCSKDGGACCKTHAH